MAQKVSWGLGHSLYIGDWQDADQTIGTFQVTVAKNRHENTDLFVYLEDSGNNDSRYLKYVVELAKSVALNIQHARTYEPEPFIHCAAGESRSVVFAALVMYFESCNFDEPEEALEHLEDQYPQARPLVSLKEQLFFLAK